MSIGADLLNTHTNVTFMFAIISSPYFYHFPLSLNHRVI